MYCSRVFSEPHQELKAGLSIQTLNTVKKQQSKLLTVYLELWALTLSLICRILFYSEFQFITDQNHIQLIKILNKVTKVITVRNYRHTWVTWTEWHEFHEIDDNKLSNILWKEECRPLTICTTFPAFWWPERLARKYLSLFKMTQLVQ